MKLVWLGQAECNDTSLTGGKASNLSRLCSEFPVPPGFCLTTAAFTLEMSDPREPDLPAEIRNILAHAYQTLAEVCGAEEPGVAVRSSAVGEDGHAVSFAGQYETFLNVIGTDALIRAVARCRASAFSDRVRAYHGEKAGPGEKGNMSVLVQQLVRADVSAVAFSVNPITGNSEDLVINANWGLGESIVGGTVTPDTYMVRKEGLGITEKHIGAKERMTILAQEGTREVAVPRIMSSQPAMSDEQIRETARMVVSLEEKMGWPADMECAWKDDRIYLLQCRPVTAFRG